MAFPLTRILVLYFYIIDPFLTRIAFWPCVHVVSFLPGKGIGCAQPRRAMTLATWQNIPAHLTAISLPCCPDARV